MSNQNSGIHLLSKDSAVSMILLLDEEGEAGARDLQKVKSNYYVALQLAMSLKEIGLVNAKKVLTPRIAYSFSLTLKGKKVADKLKEVQRIIDGQ
jgi:hypothetical protein